MKKIPYGISDFKVLKEEDYYYVDKTMYLEKLEDIARTIVYLRPRRFGKTLFTSMMSYYYDINSKDLYDDLFKDTYIYNNPTRNRNNYYVLKFDFSGMTINPNSEEEIINSFNERLYNGVNNFLVKYDMNFNIDKSLKPAEFFGTFINYFNSLKLDNKLYLIIDEYDNFSNSILSNNLDTFKNIMSNDGFIKAFYARIKEYVGIIIDRVFITGVCSISLDSMTSGFNIATNITNDFRYNSMTALTHNEIKTLLKMLPSGDDYYLEMLEYYDGYKFEEEEEKVFNPSLTMYYVKSIIETNRKPKEMLDSNIISNYEQIKNIISLGDYRKIIDDIYDNGEIVSSLKVNFDLMGEFDKNDIVSLLYYFGYLTIKGAMDNVHYIFTIPNKVIKIVYSNYYLNIMKEYKIKLEDEDESNAAYSVREEGDLRKLCDYISYLLKNADNRLYINFKEKDLQIMVYTILIKYDGIDIELEYKSGDNFIDVVIFTKKYNYVIELKYIKEKDKDCYDDIYNIAKDEIEKYQLDKNNVKKYVIIFTKSSYTLEEV